MAIPFSYSFRNLWTRRLTTVLTASGMALVVFVFAAVLMFADGFQKTLVDTGSYDNVIISRKGSGAEMQSYVLKSDASLIESYSEIAVGANGRKLLAKESVVLINLPKKESKKTSNIIIRGITENSLALRPQVKIVAGRMARPGSNEIIIGNGIANQFQNSGINNVLRFAVRDWIVVGIFDAGNTGFSSEIWGDVHQVMPAFRRPVYSSLTFRLQDAGSFDALKARIETDPRMTLEAKREIKYYQEQSETMAKFVRILGLTITIIFSLGAIIGAMITMYAAVANRTNEIGTLRALGFRRRNILAAFLMESLLLGFIGGCIGLVFASLMQNLTVSTFMSFQSFSTFAFKFKLSVQIVMESLIFSSLMGLAGGFLPAIRASRMNIVDALRAI
ncbi:MAG: multidrug ABC transporter permease [Deltaproteobacteria bacterium HGW-Deltaproteobacteria-10]|nr:MAG: multidrug ABC transporter permease [Deltaproteobacteria bacterium HGW-Deltaproteobacteria-10]